MSFNFPNSPTVGQLYPQPAVAGASVWKWNGSAWISVGAPLTILDGLVHYDVAQSLTATQQLQARQNIYAAPFDAMGLTGVQVNGCQSSIRHRSHGTAKCCVDLHTGHVSSLCHRQRRNVG
jgi:hypothetical protein